MPIVTGDAAGAPVYGGDFSWVGSDEPHASRRRLILERHPEIAQLYGPDVRTFFASFALVALQVTAAYLLRDSSWWTIAAAAYLFGGVLNHSCTLAMHELSHNLAFKRPMYNRALALFVNLPLCVPSAVTFKRYHLDHHSFQGVDGVDVDVPSVLEGRIINGFFGKFLFLLFQAAFYAVRPLMVKPKPRTTEEYFNIALALSFDAAVYIFIGPRALGYLGLSSLLGLGLHPMAGHFIAEHYIMVQGYETYSYYGPLNHLSFYVGYHNEHHDFPKVAGWNLHKVREIAHEFYEDLPHHSSWSRVIWTYLTDDSVGPFSRVKRRQKPTDEDTKEN
jgi:sphingolipid delta-4 desaturase